MTNFTPPPQSAAKAPSADPKEVAKFSAMAETWWDPAGPMAPLHRMNPVRLGVVRAAIERQFALAPDRLRPFEGLRIADIGCGGGMVAEPMARLGARVLGLDASEENIGVASAHARDHGLEIEYRCELVEDFLLHGTGTFDVVLCLEVIEHVAAPGQFLRDTAKLLRPGGLLITATLNRTARALAEAVIGAEYVLRWLPRGTHDWSKFLTPDELTQFLRGAGLEPQTPVGLSYHPVTAKWSASDNLSVNYMIAAGRPI